MVQFNSWKDNYIFLRDYGKYSCLNCRFGGTKYTDDTEEHTDSEYAHLFCKHTISMVRLDLMMVCAKWEDNDGNTLPLEDGDAEMWNLSDNVIDILDKTDYRWSIEEIKELIQNEED